VPRKGRGTLLKINKLGLTELNDEELKDVQQKTEIYKTNAKEKKKNEIPIIREPSRREKKKREILDL
jgi:hypothetical protein